METASGRRRTELRADCERCIGLCCVAPAFAKSADFALTKPAGAPCRNLGEDYRCLIHSELVTRGFPGCTAYDCFGAGQAVSQGVYELMSWRESRERAAEMFAVFAVMRDLHELLWLLEEAKKYATTRELAARLEGEFEKVESTTRLEPGRLRRVLIEGLRREINPLLVEVSRLAREGTPAADFRGAELIGADLREEDLRGANLRGALLLGADLRAARVGKADFTGADLRGALVAGTDLRSCLFLSQMQVGAAVGDAATALPPTLQRPHHWTNG